jgi:acyl carrier protein
MKDSLEGIVRRAVAQHLGVDSSEIQSTHHFQRDLAFQPLDVVLIAIRLEEIEDVELPIDRLDSIETVGELTRLLRLTLLVARDEGRPFIALRRGHPRIVRRASFRSPQGE